MGDRIYREWYILNTGRTVVAGSGMTPVSIRVPDDADFELAQILCAYCTSTLFKYQIKKGAADKYLSKNPVEYGATNCFGLWTVAEKVSSQVIYDIPPEGRVIFPSGADVIIELTDYSTASNTIDFALGGFKIRRIPG